MGRKPISESPPAALDPSDLRDAAAAIEREFPLAVRRTGLVLYDVDPARLQAQWQVTADDLNRAHGVFPPEKGGVRPVLRLWRLDTEGGPREAAVLPQPPARGPLEGEAVFTVGGQGERFQAELGLASADGGWLLLARSNLLEVIRPRERPVPARRAMPPTAELERGPRPLAEPQAPPAPELATPPALAVGAEPAAHPAADPAATRPPEPDAQAAPAGGAGPPRIAPPAPSPRQPSDALGARRPEPTLDPPGFPLEPIFPNPLDPPSVLRQTPSGQPLRGDTGTPHCLLRPPHTEAGPERQDGSPIEQASRSDSAIPHAAFPIPHSSSSIPQSAVRMPQSALPPPILPSTLHEWRGEGDLLAHHDPTHGLSSRVLHAQPGATDLELHAELLVWGRAPNGSLVELMGRRLRVGADGRFLVREAVEDPVAFGIALYPPAPEPDAE